MTGLVIIVVLRPFLELALQAAAQDYISPSSPAPSIDGSREQLVKRDKVMF